MVTHRWRGLSTDSQQQDQLLQHGQRQRYNAFSEIHRALNMNGESQKDGYQGLGNIVLLCLAGLCSLVIFAWPASRMLTPDFSSELVRHSQLLRSLEQQQAPPYSLWYLLQKLIARDNLSEHVLLASGLLLIGSFATLKGFLLTGLLRSSRFGAIQSLVGGLLLGTAVAMPLPMMERISPMYQMKTQYLGTIPANTFMSATQLVANVGVLPAFVGLQLWCLKPTRKGYAIMLSLCMLATISKAGIAPALLAAIICCSIVHCWQSGSWQLQSLWQILIAAALLLTPSAIVSHYYMSGGGWMNIQAVLAPFATWKAYSAQIGIDILSSLAFPLMVLAALIMQWKHERGNCDRSTTALMGLLPSIIATTTALLIFILIAEKVNGAFLHSGNFIWAAISANAGWHLTAFISLKSLDPSRTIVPIIILLLEAAGGLSYIWNYMHTGSFL